MRGKVISFKVLRDDITKMTADDMDAIRNAIFFGGDSDTIVAIAGSIAEAAYGIPDWIRDKALIYLDAPLLDVLERWEQYLGLHMR